MSKFRPFRGLMQALIATLMLLASNAAPAQTYPNCGQGGANWMWRQLPLHPAPGPSEPDPCAASNWTPQCWATHQGSSSADGTGKIWYPLGVSNALRFNLDLLEGVTAPDFVPPSTTAAASSIPLLPAELLQERPRVGGRPVLAGQVDLITGNGLLQDTDLELPFGGAMYRLIRSHSSSGPQTAEGVSQSLHPVHWVDESGQWWDWCGTNWTISSNPIFLIDCTYQGMVTSSDPPRCYFLPDSLHAIPFVRDTNGHYSAPPQFRAHLKAINGNWDSIAQEWAPTPTTNGMPEYFELWLYDGAVKYTIKPYYDQMPFEDRTNNNNPNDLVSAHQRPDYSSGLVDVGTGMPYYGLVKTIEDRHGNRIEFTHAEDLPENGPGTPPGFRQWSEPDSSPLMSGCVKCSQNCVDRGQLRYVKLYAAGQSEATWTLLFQHRRFSAGPSVAAQAYDPWIQANSASIPPEARLENQWWYTSTAVHAMYAFPHDVDINTQIQYYSPVTDSGWRWVLEDWMFWKGPTRSLRDRYDATTQYMFDPAHAPQPADPWHGLNKFEDIEDYSQYPLFGPSGLPDNWTRQVRYLYSEAIAHYPNASSAHATAFRASILTDAEAAIPLDILGVSWWVRTQRLIKATTLTRASGDNSDEVHDTTIYRCGGGLEQADYRCIFRPDTVRKLVHALKEDNVAHSHSSADHSNTGHPCAAAEWSEFCLLRMSDAELVPFQTAQVDANGQMQTVRTTLSSAADFYVLPSSDGGPADPMGGHPLNRELVENFIKLDGTRLLHVDAWARGDGLGISAFRVQGRGPDADGSYRLYHYLYMPQSSPLGTGEYLHTGNGVVAPRQELLHYPYRWTGQHNYPDPYPDQAAVSSAPLTEPTWITVVDRFDNAGDASVNPFQYDNASTVAQYPVPRTRRVLQINAAGYVLRDRTWEFSEQGATITHSEGFAEEYHYDDQSRVTEIRSAGWSIQENPGGPGGASDGLIRVFRYPYEQPDPHLSGSAVEQTTTRRLPHLEGVKQGTSGQPVWLAQRWFHPDRPDLVTTERMFPVVGDTTQSYEETRNIYDLSAVPNTTDPVQYKIVAQDTIAGSACRKNETSALYHAVTKTRYDSTGALIWHGYGTLQDPAEPGQTGDEFFVDLLLRDGQGRVVAQVVDYAADSAALPDHYPVSAGIPAVPSDLARFPAHSSGNSAIAATTAYEYDERGLLSKVTYPTGRFDLIKYRKIENEVWKSTYKGCVGLGGNLASITGGGSMELGAVSAGSCASELSQLARTAGGGYLVKEVSWAQLGQAVNPETLTDPFRVQAVVTPKLDSTGRPIGVGITTTDGASVSVAISYAPGGQIDRAVNARGVVTRNRFNELGLLTHMYRGSHDVHPFWGNTGPNDTPNDDLALIQKVTYGTGVYDLHLPTQIRRYRSKVADQYVSTTTEDSVGWTENREYDWRMRVVVVRENTEETSGGPAVSPIRHQVTFYDNLNRVRFVAVYGSTLPSLGTIDPRTATASAALPSAQSILSTNPLSLSETRYDGRGAVAETREYNSDTTVSAAVRAQEFLANVTYYDHAGRPTFSRSPNDGDTLTVYDAAGREVRRSTVAGDAEVLRVESKYGAESGPIEIATSERISSAGSALTAENSARSVIHNWYDPSNRLVAQVDWGTGRADGAFVSTATVTTPSTRASLDNEDLVVDTAVQRWTTLNQAYGLGTSPSVRVTTYGYDDRNRVVERVDPSQVLSKYTYDDSGQLVLMAENASDPSAANRRVTAYRYQNGLLTGIGAVRNGSLLPVLNWGNTNATVQITRVEYGTNEVVYPDGSLGSYSGELPKAIRFPQAPCGCDTNSSGQITIDDLFLFTNAWFNSCMGSSGSPCNGMTSDFNGDGISSIDDLFLFYNCYFAPPSGCSAQPLGGDLVFTYTPEGLVQSRAFDGGSKFNYSYDELGQLSRIAVTDPIGQYIGADAPVNAVSRVDYAYDALSRLVRSDAYAQAAPGETGRHVVASSLFAYDGLGRLLREHLAIGELATTSTPATVYGWQSIPSEIPATDGFRASRLGHITYPLPHTVSSEPAWRECAFTYGATDSLDDQLSRITQMSGGLAKFGYIGLNRRVSTHRGVGAGGAIAVRQTFGDESGNLPGLDVYGRVRQLEYIGHNIDQESSPITVFGAQHTYDVSDNRKTDSVSRADLSGGSTLGNRVDRSWVFGYDKLQRLVTARTGTLTTASNGTPAIVTDAQRRDYSWALDDLGNWGRKDGMGGYTTCKEKSYVLETNQDQEQFDPHYKEVLHRTNDRNEISTYEQKNTPLPDGVLTMVSQPFSYDRPGRLVYDGRCVHRYDAWGRLCELRTAALTVGPDGTINWAGGGPGSVGGLAAHYTYDGLGRLIATQKPVARDSSGAVTAINVVRHYYDGARRIQDLRSEAIPLNHPVTMELARWPLGPLGENLAQNTEFGLDREYVYDPTGDVDEQIAQIGYATIDSLNGPCPEDGALIYVLQDANLNVVSITDGAGIPIAQVGYTPYGKPTFLDKLQWNTAEAALASSNPVGHQGLFYDRFDAAACIGCGGGENETLSPGAGSWGYYHNRNRTYAPELGRFVQRDPNATGQAIGELWTMGNIPVPMAIGVSDLSSMYADGASLHGYVSASPLSRRDSQGLDDFSVGGLSAKMGIGGMVFGSVGGGIAGWDQTQTWQGAARGAFIGGVAGFAGGATFGMALPVSGGMLAGLVGGSTSGFVGYVLHQAIHGGELVPDQAYQESLTNAAFWAAAGGISDSFFEATWSFDARKASISQASGNYVRNTGMQQSDMTALQMWFGTGEQGAMRAAPRPPGAISTDGLLAYRRLIQKNPDALVVKLRTDMIDAELSRRNVTPP